MERRVHRVSCRIEPVSRVLCWTGVQCCEVILLAFLLKGSKQLRPCKECGARRRAIGPHCRGLPPALSACGRERPVVRIVGACGPSAPHEPQPPRVPPLSVLESTTVPAPRECPPFATWRGPWAFPCRLLLSATGRPPLRFQIVQQSYKVTQRFDGQVAGHAGAPSPPYTGCTPLW